VSELPLGWISLECGNTFEQISTSNIKVKTKDTNQEGLFPVIDQGANYIAGYVDDEESVIIIEKPVCVFGDHTRVVKWVDFNFVPGADGIKVLVPKAYLYERFFYYQLRHAEVKDRGYSRHFKYLKETIFKVAPLNEQIRIADKLDSILAKVDQAQARFDKIPSILKRFRQSVLAAATSGELTRDWRDNEESNWKTVIFGSLIKNGPQNGIYKHSSLYGGGTKIIRIDGFYDGVLSPWSTFKRVQIEHDELEKWKLNVDDILINRVNSIEYLGKCGYVNDLPEDAVFESNIMRVELDKSLVIPRFIKIFLSSPIGLSRLRSNAKHAVNQASINQTDVKSVEIQLPNLEEQAQIAHIVEELLCKADTFEKQYLEAKRFINRLTQSILAKAFRGELVEQNPNDESASQLLERIKSQQLEAPKSTKKARSTKVKAAQKVEDVSSTEESVQLQSEVLSILQNANVELSAQQLMDKLTEQSFEQVDALFTELKCLLDAAVITKAGSGESCTFKAIKK
tara:strand:- start:12993 stop:14528 length:1536 start_codon:yes stop_codon:yes gene_type:complete